MNPHENKPQNVTPLPEVPKINSFEPQNPSSSFAEPVASVPVEPPVFEPAPVEPAMAPESVAQSPIIPPAIPTTAPSSFNQQTPGRPIPPLSPQPVIENTSPTLPGKKGLGLGAILGIIGGILVVLGGVVAVLFLIGALNQGKVSESDLMSSTTSDTSYLRPKQWSQITASGIDGYGNMLAKDGKSTAAIFVKKGSYFQSGIKKATDTQLSSFRSLMVKANSNNTAETELKETGSCSEIKDVKTVENTNKNNNSVGVFTTTGTCIKDGGTYKMIYYALLGNDGYARTIVIIATEDNWKVNEKVFNKMIDSVDQS